MQKIDPKIEVSRHLNWKKTTQYIMRALGCLKNNEFGYEFNDDALRSFAWHVNNYNQNIYPLVLDIIRLGTKRIYEARKGLTKEPIGNMSIDTFVSRNCLNGHNTYVYRHPLRENRELRVVVGFMNHRINVMLQVRNTVLKDPVHKEYVNFFPDLYSRDIKGWVEMLNFSFTVSGEFSKDKIQVLEMVNAVLDTIPYTLPKTPNASQMKLCSDYIYGVYFSKTITENPHHHPNGILDQVRELMNGNTEEALFNLKLLSYSSKERYYAVCNEISVPSSVLQDDGQYSFPYSVHDGMQRLHSELNAPVLFGLGYQNAIQEFHRNVIIGEVWSTK